ncbi:hypothetical protein GCM10027612_43760 [Microbispora bryophytorum subsp. camponoti]
MSQREFKVVDHRQPLRRDARALVHPLPVQVARDTLAEVVDLGDGAQPPVLQLGELLRNGFLDGLPRLRGRCLVPLGHVTSLHGLFGAGELGVDDVLVRGPAAAWPGPA